MKLVFREYNPQLYGVGTLLFEWRPGGNAIAIAGSSGIVRLFNRYSEVTEEFNINEAVASMKWDPCGDVLAIANSRSSTLVVVLYECSTSNIHTVDVSTGAKAVPTVLCWAPNSSVLLIGDNKGNFVLLNYRLSRKVPMMGKHQKAIRSAAWNGEGTIFALGSEDTSITLNNAEGETLNTFSCNGEIVELQFTSFRGFASEREEDFISAIVAHRNLMIVRLSNPSQPINLQFQERYGNLVRTLWFANGNLLVGFDQGFIVCLSAERSAESISQELFSIQEYKSSLASITINGPLGKMFSIGDNLLKGRDLIELGEISDLVNVDSDDSGLVEVGCSEDGSMTTVSARSGAVCVYLTKLPMLAAASSTHIAVLASLTEISIYQEGEVQPAQSMNIKIEPSLIAVGAKHIAIVLNNKAWFYEIRRNGTSFLYEHDYLTTILKMKLNREFVMARLDNRVHLRRIARLPGDLSDDSPTDQWANDVLFPDCNESNPRDVILDADLSEKFFIYSTASRFLNYYSLANGRFVSDFKHSSEIRKVFSEPDGIRTIFHDSSYDWHIYSPADDQLSKIPRQGPFMSTHQYDGCLWESFTVDKNTFLVHDQHTICVFMHVRNARKEHCVTFLCSVQIPFGNVPIFLSKGIVHCHTQNGRVNTILLKSHKTETQFGGKTTKELSELLQQSLTLKRWRNAWQICEELKDQSAWRSFAETAMLDGDIELAVRIFRHLGDVAMVWALEELLDIEDQQILSGHVAVLLGHFDEADAFFSNSSQPKLALEMRRDVQHWEKALELARQTAPDEMPSIAKEYAMQLEFVGQHRDALRYYEEALISPSNANENGLSEEQEEHNWVCWAGLARMALYMGDLKRGVEISLKLPSRLAKRDCGIVLEQLRQFDEAGSVYEAGQFYDRAAAAFLKSRNLLKVHKLMEQVRSPKLLSQYGKILEKDKNYERALKAFQRAHDNENQIRLLLRHLKKVNEAVKLAQESKSVEGSKMVASYFSDIGQYESAIEFLVLSHCYQEAFEMAKSSGQIRAYARALETNLGTERGDAAVLGHYGQLAEHFHTEGDVLNAGKFAGMAQMYKKALPLLLSEQQREEEALGLAVEYVAVSGDKELVEELIAHLMGERGDGEPKDPKFLFQLYVKLKMYNEAAKTALIISQEQQQRGFYKTAHDLLFEMCQTLRRERIRTPSEMDNSLMLLHSYNLVKALLKKGDNYAGARLLCRVVANIGQFPAHAVPILTSAVIACTKAGFKRSAFKFASQLMQPSYRPKIDEKYKKKIELVIRRFGQNAPDVEEHSAPCPFCDGPVGEFVLSCPNCQTTIPYCIFTGRHVVRTDFALCPHCFFPGSFSEFNKSLNANCPMCYEKLPDQISPSKFEEFIKENSFNNLI